MSAPALRLLRRNLPASWIGIVLQQRYLGQFNLSEVADAEFPEIDETLPFPQQIRLWRELYRETDIDCLVLHRITRPDLPALVAGLLENIPHRVGGADKGLQALLTDLYTPSQREKVAYYSLNLIVEWLRMAKPEGNLQWPDLISTAPASHRWDVLIAPFAQHTKLWASESWRELLSIFRSASLRVALSAPPSLAEAARDLLGEHASWVVNLSKQNSSVADLFDDVRSSRCLVSIDTGIRHVAATIGVPCVVIANEREHRDIIGGYITTECFLVHDVPCAPCGAEPCPLGHLQCVRGITVGQVLAALDALVPNLFPEFSSTTSINE